MTKSIQLFLEMSTTYRLFSYLLADNQLVCRLHMQYMISKSNVKLLSVKKIGVPISVKPTMCNKTIQFFQFSVCEIQNNQGQEKCHQSRQII